MDFQVDDEAEPGVVASAEPPGVMASAEPPGMVAFRRTPRGTRRGSRRRASQRPLREASLRYRVSWHSVSTTARPEREGLRSDIGLQRVRTLLYTFFFWCQVLASLLERTTVLTSSLPLARVLLSRSGCANLLDRPTRSRCSCWGAAHQSFVSVCFAHV